MDYEIPFGPVKRSDLRQLREHGLDLPGLLARYAEVRRKHRPGKSPERTTTESMLGKRIHSDPRPPSEWED